MDTAGAKPIIGAEPRQCDGWPTRTVFDRGMPVDAHGRWITCPEPVVSVMFDTDDKAYVGLCERHRAEWREHGR